MCKEHLFLRLLSLTFLEKMAIHTGLDKPSDSSRRKQSQLGFAILNSDSSSLGLSANVFKINIKVLKLGEGEPLQPDLCSSLIPGGGLMPKTQELPGE